MQTNITEKQLEELKGVIMVFAPLCLYGFVMQLEITNVGKKIGTYYPLDDIAGRSLNAWPSDVKEEYYKLCETVPVEALQNAFAEIHYFLIFTIAAKAAKVVNMESQTRLLDTLFSVFTDNQVWSEKHPSADAFTKYRKSDNPMLAFSYHLCTAVGVKGAFEVLELTMSVGNIIQSFVLPAVERILRPAGDA